MGRFGIIFLICLLAGFRLSAQLVDNFDATTNFSAGFNGTLATAGGNVIGREVLPPGGGHPTVSGGAGNLNLALDNWSAVTTYEVQGDFYDPSGAANAPFAGRLSGLSAISVVPGPAPVALVVAGLLLFAFFHRFRALADRHHVRTTGAFNIWRRNNN